MSKISGNFSHFAFSGKKLCLLHVESDNDGNPIIVDVQSNSSVGKPLETDYVDCLALSGNNVALCFRKELFLYEISKDGCAFVHSAPIEKKAVCVRFSNNSKSILVAERSGNADFYSYATRTLVKENTCLGHCSMLTDALFTPNDRYVITSDRDERIRVSHFPNTYNIQSFCLGHECFVSSLSLLPSDNRILVSSSGDCTLRLWDYEKGAQKSVFSHGTAPFMKSVSIQNNTENILAVQLYQTSDVLVLTVPLKDSYEISLKHVVSSPSEILDICILGMQILYLVNDDKSVRVLETEENIVSSSFLDRVNESLSKETKLSPSATFELLFKKEFNNMEVYHERKKARLEK